MENRSLLYWVRESSKTVSLSVLGSLVYSILMGWMQLEAGQLGTGFQLLRNCVAAGTMYYCIMVFAFLCRFALDSAQRQIPLCISYGERRKDVFFNMQLGLFIQLAVTITALAVMIFGIVPGSTSEPVYAGLLAHPLWSVCVGVVLCLAPLAISQLGCAVTILTEGRSASWITMATIFAGVILVIGGIFAVVICIDDLFGNWKLLTGSGSVVLVLYLAGSFWIHHLLKNYRVSL